MCSKGQPLEHLEMLMRDTLMLDTKTSFRIWRWFEGDAELPRLESATRTRSLGELQFEDGETLILYGCRDIDRCFGSLGGDGSSGNAHLKPFAPLLGEVCSDIVPVPLVRESSFNMPCYTSSMLRMQLCARVYCADFSTAAPCH
jgi:hypothetical protein